MNLIVIGQVYKNIQETLMLSVDVGSTSGKKRREEEVDGLLLGMNIYMPL